MSASEWPANDWRRVTVNTPVTGEGTATTAPTASAMCSGPLPKKPGSMMCRRMFTMSPDDAEILGGGFGGVDALRRGHHEDPAVHPDHVDVLAVQPGQNLGLDHPAGATARHPAPAHVAHRAHHPAPPAHAVRPQPPRR